MMLMKTVAIMVIMRKSITIIIISIMKIFEIMIIGKKKKVILTSLGNTCYKKWVTTIQMTKMAQIIRMSTLIM